jgi:hypothetical protein
MGELERETEQESEIYASQLHVFRESKSDMVLNSQQNECPAESQVSPF